MRTTHFFLSNNNTQTAVSSHEVSADLPNAKTATVASDVPQANIAQSQTTDATAPVNQQLI
ncbi:hypothetical protein BXA17_20115, partial [Acinetobacter baumannii]|uniref:hypothetical protein n=1 Tax=Acinetobacter baumannii TaxID=470 RepID=UPI000B70BB71